MLGLELNYVSKVGPWSKAEQAITKRPINPVRVWCVSTYKSICDTKGSESYTLDA